jgi:hypothetical protein
MHIEYQPRKSSVLSSFKYPVNETPPLMLKDIVPKATANITSLSDFIVYAPSPASSNSSKRKFVFLKCAVSYLVFITINSNIFRM